MCRVYSPLRDWILRRTTEDQPRGIRWTLFYTLEDLDLADDLALLSHAHQHMQEKTRRHSKFGQLVGLQISKRETEVMTLNVNAPAPVLFNDQVQTPLPIRAPLSDRIEVPTRTFRADWAKPGTPLGVLSSSPYGIKTKLKLYQICVLSTLRYGSECWQITEHDFAKL